MADKKTMTKEDVQKEAQERHEKITAEIMKMIADGKLPEVRSMTRKQRRELDEQKLNYLKTVFQTKETAIGMQEKCYDWILDHVYPDFDFDSLPNNVCFFFGEQVYSATYSDKFAEKN